MAKKQRTNDGIDPEPCPTDHSAGCRFECLRCLVDALEECTSMCCEDDEEAEKCCAAQKCIKEAILIHLDCCPAAVKK